MVVVWPLFTSNHSTSLNSTAPSYHGCFITLSELKGEIIERGGKKNGHVGENTDAAKLCGQHNSNIKLGSALAE